MLDLMDQYAGVLGFRPPLKGITFRQLWVMYHARQQSRRLELLQQAALVWSSVTADDAAEFVRCGVLKATPAGEEPKMPYDHGMLKRMTRGR